LFNVQSAETGITTFNVNEKRRAFFKFGVFSASAEKIDGGSAPFAR
jgi:hypothetical protein